MGRKRIYQTVRIENVESQIALWELRGRDEMAYGLRLFFGSILTESEIEKHKAIYAKSNPELQANYSPKQETTEQTPSRKTGTFREVRTIRNRSNGGKAYRWAYDVTYQDGRRIRSKSVGRVGDK